MMTASADDASRPDVPRSGARKRSAQPRRTGRTASPAKPGSGVAEPAVRAVAADVMAVLAAFGLGD